MKNHRLQKFTILTFIVIVFMTAGQENTLASTTQDFEPLVIIKSHDALQALKYGEMVNITIDILNDSEIDLYNVSFTDIFNNDTFRVMGTLASIENSSIIYEFAENTNVTYTWNQILPGERVKFWIELKVETKEPIQYSISSTTITFENELGITGLQVSNIIIIDISGEIEVEELLPERIHNLEMLIQPIIYLLPIILLISFNFLLKKKK